MAALAGPIIGASSSISTGYAQSSAAKQQSEYQAMMMRFNSQVADFQGESAIKRGEKDANQALKQAHQVKGSQRAALAAQGIEVDSGTAAQIQEDTAVMAAQDAVTIKSNAWREAWGYKVSAMDSRQKADMTIMAGRNEARNTLLTGGMKALGYAADGASKFKGKGSSGSTETKRSVAGQSYYDTSGIA